MHMATLKAFMSTSVASIAKQSSLYPHAEIHMPVLTQLADELVIALTDSLRIIGRRRHAAVPQLLPLTHEPTERDSRFVTEKTYNLALEIAESSISGGKPQQAQAAHGVAE